MNIGVDLVHMEFTGISLTAEVSAGLSTGVGASLSGHGRAWPSVNSVFDLNGTGHSTGGALAGGLGLSADALFFDSPQPVGGQVSVEAGGRFSPVTGVDFVGTRGETRTLIGYDREQGFQLFGN